MNNAERKTESEKLAWLATKPTEELETELSKLSASITTDAEKLADSQALFQSVREMLKNRREVKDEQPVPVLMTSEQLLQQQLEMERMEVKALTNKLIAMESEQAKLVIETETAKYDARVAQDRLALVAKQNTKQS